MLMPFQGFLKALPDTFEVPAKAFLIVAQGQVQLGESVLKISDRCAARGPVSELIEIGGLRDALVILFREAHSDGFSHPKSPLA